MASVRRTPRSAASLAISAAIDADDARMFAGREPLYPNGVLFIPAELATSPELERGLAEHPLVVIVDEHGDEQWLPGTGTCDEEAWPMTA